MVEPAAANKSDAYGKKIMVVDDDEAITQVLRMSLEVEGFQVKVGRDGRDILKRALDFKPDLIVTDLMMPGVDGYDLIRSLQVNVETRVIPVLMITGRQMDGTTKAMIQAEPNIAGYFEKPFRPEKIVQKVHQVLNTMTREEKARKNAIPDLPGVDDMFRL